MNKCKSVAIPAKSLGAMATRGRPQLQYRTYKKWRDHRNTRLFAPETVIIPSTGTTQDNAETMRPFISCIIPAFNEERNLLALLPELFELLPELSSKFEVLVVDDGSDDRSVELLEPLTHKFNLRIICLSRNFGKEAAISAGLEHAAGDVVVLLDADLQHPPSLLVELFHQWQAGYEMVVAKRVDRLSDGWVHGSLSQAFYKLINGISVITIVDGAGDFRLMTRQVVDAIKQMPERSRFMKGIYSWVGFKTKMIEYTAAPRRDGKSKFTLRSLVRLARIGIISFSDIPLRLWTGVGAFFSLLAFFLGAWFFIQMIANGTVFPIWASTAISILMLSGIQLISIGILGEYIAEVFKEVKARPAYIVSRTIASKNEK
jgi:polyisoprenyl-phosphate glycosyltransferase